MEPLVLVLLAFGAAVLVILIKWVNRRSLGYIKGPPAPSWLYGMLHMIKPPRGKAEIAIGHQLAQSRSLECAEDDFTWMKEYGTAYRLKGCLGVSRIYRTV